MGTRRSLVCGLMLLTATLLGAAWPSAAQQTAATPADAGGTAATPADAGGTAAPAQAETPSDGFRVGAFTFKPWGRIKLDVIRDFEPITSEDYFDTRTIAIDGSEGTNSNIHAKETRLSLDIRGMAQKHELQMYLETDFYGTSSALRLRHAYGRWNGLLAGQTWSTFMDDDNLPRTIDFESPTAFALVRQAQVRWTSKVNDVFSWSAAMEDNKSSVIVPSNLSGKVEYPSPDFVGRVRFDIPHGHITSSAFVGAARFRPTGQDPETVTLWGTMGSAKFSTWGKDTVYSVVTWGDGIGRYRAGTAAILDETGNLHAIGGLAFMGGYEHFWADRWSTNGVYSAGAASDEPFFTSAINRDLEYGAVNLLYWFLGDRAWTGVEYLYGHREVYADVNNAGSAHRIQYAVRFNLP